MGNPLQEIAQLERDLVNLFAAFPELQDDEQLRKDTLDGDTNLHSVVERLLGTVVEAGALIEANKIRVDQISARNARLAQRKDAARLLIQKLMDRAHIRSLELPEATISIRAGSASVRLIVEQDVPEKYFRVKTERSLDRKAILDALKAGEDVPGCALSNGAPTLMIKQG